MRQFHRPPTSPRQKGTRWPRPCAQSPCHLSRRNKRDTRSPAARRARSIMTKLPKLFSCNDAEPFHFPIKPDAIEDEGKRGGERSDRAREINRPVFNEI